MSEQYDIVIRGGTVLDGSGSAPFAADVAIRDGRIAAIGDIAGTAGETIDAEGKLVMPGFIDIHTHYDGQATWESRMAPSSNHGVTTVVTGNCGVGFAPCKPEDRDILIQLMEGVEDIPGVVMTEGLPWNWRSFPEYLDVLASGQYDVDIATQLPHNCLRVFVMGQRGANLEEANAEDLAQMRELTREAMAAGAIGVGTSRSIFHRFPDGRLVPTKDAGEAELNAIAAGMQDAGHGVFEALFDLDNIDNEFNLLRRVSEKADVPVSFTLAQTLMTPDAWKDGLRLLEQANSEGAKMRGQVIGRPTGLLLGLNLSLQPFTNYPYFKQNLAQLSLEDRVAEMRKPEVRAALLAETPDDPSHPIQQFLTPFEKMFPMGTVPNYEPDPADSIKSVAEREGRTPQEVAYDALLEQDGHATLFVTAANYVDFNLEPVLEMLKSEHTVLGLGDGGAHYGMICDAGYPTFMLTYWGRDRKVGEKLPLPVLVRELSKIPAETVGLNDRGLIAEGYRADINVVDFDKLVLHAPRVAFDLPAGGRRLTQQASGFAATILNGKVTYRDGEPTGELPGRLVRGPQKVAA